MMKLNKITKLHDQNDTLQNTLENASPAFYLILT